MYRHQWQQANGTMKGEIFHSWYAIPENGHAVQLPRWINLHLEVAISHWLTTQRKWDELIASKALAGKVLEPKIQKKYDPR